MTGPVPEGSTALLTDRYELTMVAAALADGTADRACVFELFARRLPDGRRYGVVAGTGRLLAALERFRFGEAELAALAQVVDPATLDWLRDYRFTGDVDGYPEGELYFPGSPVLTVTGTFADAVILETLALSIYNHDCAIASAAARMVTASAGRPLIEMGSRRTHEEAAVAAARAAYLAGFATTSNLAAGRRYGIPTAGTAAHAWVLLHDDERAAFRSQVAALGTGTTLLVDTYDIRTGIANAVEVAGTGLGAVRIDSGDLGEMAHQAREQLDALGATGTRIVLSGDLDEYAIASLRAEPVDSYGVGTSLVTGSGAPTAGMVYKLVEVDGRPVSKRSTSKESRGGRKSALRRYKPTGTAVEEIVFPHGGPPATGPHDRELPVPLVRGGELTPDAAAPLEDSRERLRAALVAVPWEGLKLSRGEPAIPTTFVTES
ncbi:MULTISPECIES: nicotinate phosphoribosyltransferase [Pseudonocardia]|uniref:Nicotinate phosphoribosyltransferase n=2 Tax=Pseudonocardia TaxID=1847 RepID=A0A1Y2MMV2_PSEAH|nr:MULTISPECIES: nicotinate phosphoribosyltransferase [Pseudonocardia]OSY36580.1 Nicotinate phosphoribosyltransferase pncB1 [Pseudonocardia autotrophica]TDN76238.1 nicotinate phosphoribosyltransferase [Pseudonocardia autotrophica]BBG00220.1 nicotinate phosphoribosyltransferase [Pseudonocardia autotrophica]GEC28713.1 nicotinate phosphoribosyltransferase [Pseudonocardia saturnea]